MNARDDVAAMASRQPVPASAPEEAPASPRRWIVLAVVLAAGFIELLDINIVNIAVPSIQRDLGSSDAQIQWVLAGYLLAFGVTQVTGGRLGDIYGRKRQLLAGTAGFTLASALCGLSLSPQMLIGMRILQGLTASLLLPQVLGIIRVSFPSREVGTALGLFGTMVGLAFVAGPLAGGLLIRWDPLDAGWRLVFLVNLPIGLAVLLAASVVLPESRAPHPLRLDPVGVGLLTAALLMLVYPLVEGRELGWPRWAYLLMAASLFAFVALAAHEARQKERGNSPLLDIGLFRRRAFAGGLVASVTTMVGGASFFLVWTVFLQSGLGLTALGAGLTMLPWALGFASASTASGPLVRRLERRLLWLAALLTVVSLLALAWTARRYGVSLHPWQLALPLLLHGASAGFMVSPLMDIVLTNVSPQDAGAAAGAITTAQQVGHSVGIALLGVTFFSVLARNLSRLPQAATATYGQVYLDALQVALWFLAGAALVTFAAIFLIPARKPMAGR